jgi:hypothetical protein
MALVGVVRGLGSVARLAGRATGVGKLFVRGAISPIIFGEFREVRERIEAFGFGYSVDIRDNGGHVLAEISQRLGLAGKMNISGATMRVLFPSEFFRNPDFYKRRDRFLGRVSNEKGRRINWHPGYAKYMYSKVVNQKLVVGSRRPFPPEMNRTGHSAVFRRLLRWTLVRQEADAVERVLAAEAGGSLSLPTRS